LRRSSRAISAARSRLSASSWSLRRSVSASFNRSRRRIVLALGSLSFPPHSSDFVPKTFWLASPAELAGACGAAGAPHEAKGSALKSLVPYYSNVKDNAMSRQPITTRHSHSVPGVTNYKYSPETPNNPGRKPMPTQYTKQRQK